MEKKSLVSVIIPAYNAAQYLAEAIESVLGQTYPSVEIIVIDDGSTDGTKDIAHQYWKKGKIKYLHQENRGLSAARNAGIRAAQGEYIALLDSDDIFLASKLERQIAYLEAHPACGISYCSLYHFYEEEPDRLLQLQYKYYSGDAVFPHLLYKNFINPLSVVARRQVFDECGYFNEAMRRSEDWEYWVRAAYRGVRFCFLPEPLAKYRMRLDGLSYGVSSEVERKATVVAMFRELKKMMPARERWRHHMNCVIAYHWIKYAYAFAARRIFFLRRMQALLQRARFRGV